MNKYLVEFLGTLFFLYVILVASAKSSTLGTIGTAIAIGSALAISIYLGGKISGGNFNPAVTVMMAAAGRQPNSDVIPYILAQIAGGLVALEIYKKAQP
tara:strand:- start:721 stop:1017 length:297 start_codon:yes stop_codon:yes gene_type:complete